MGEAISWQARHLVHAPCRSMQWATSAALFAPKVTAGFMNGVRPVSKHCMQRHNFFIGSLSVVRLAFCSSRPLIFASTPSNWISPRSSLKRTCGPDGGPRVKSSRGKRPKQPHFVGVSCAREHDRSRDLGVDRRLIFIVTGDQVHKSCVRGLALNHVSS